MVIVHGMGSGSFFGRKTWLLREIEAAENVPDPLVLREIDVHHVNGCEMMRSSAAGERRRVCQLYATQL